MNIAVIGAGYVGLTTAAGFSQLGHAVTCMDVDKDRVAALHNGHVPIYEPGLADLVGEQLAAGRLNFSASLDQTVPAADAVFLCVGTPPLADGDTDLRFIFGAVDDVAGLMRPDAVLVIKSTVPAGTARLVRERARSARRGQPLSVASNPEFLREGSALKDFTSPDRLVVGVDDDTAAAVLKRIYAPLAERAPMVLTSTANAELIKYAANALLALRIGFVNDIADLCEVLGGDVRDVVRGIGLDHRIGSAYLQPGPGFGGSCFPKDTRSLAATGRRHGVPQHLVEVLVERNEQRKSGLATRILAQTGARPGQVVTVLGTAFKADTDDVRDSAALAVIAGLAEAGLEVRAHDPQARIPTLKCCPDLDWYDCPYAAADGAHAVVIMTEWGQYHTLDTDRLAAMMAGDVVIDYRNILDADRLRASGLRLLALGRSATGSAMPVANRAGGGKLVELAASPL